MRYSCRSVNDLSATESCQSFGNTCPIIQRMHDCVKTKESVVIIDCFFRFRKVGAWLSLQEKST